MLSIWSLLPPPFLKLRHLEVNSPMLKPSMQAFKHDLTGMGDKCNCSMLNTYFSTTLLGVWGEYWPFDSWSHCWVFQIFWHIECKTKIDVSSRVLSSSAGIAMCQNFLKSNASLGPLDLAVKNVWLWLLYHIITVTWFSRIFLYTTESSSILFLSFWSLHCLLGHYCYVLFWDPILDNAKFLRRSLVLPLLVVFFWFYAFFIVEGLLISLLSSLDFCI